jgi:acetylornithine deacetylase/succinyl-diaminopimelate desuccinylase-like protein
MRTLIALLATSAILSGTAAAQDTESEHARKTLEIYTRIIEMETAKGLGNVPKMARYLADELIAAGIPAGDIEILPVDDTAALIARYRGDDSSGKAPILLLGHMDVVEAYAKDWIRPPFELTKDDTYFFARGSIDNKFGVAHLTSTFIRLKKEGFVPNRDLILVFSGDEVLGNETRVKVVKNKVAPPFRKAEFEILYGHGISREGEIIDLGVQENIVEKSGSWYSYNGDRVGQGKENARDYLIEHPEIATEIEQKIRARLLPTGPKAVAAAAPAEPPEAKQA